MADQQEQTREQEEAEAFLARYARGLRHGIVSRERFTMNCALRKRNAKASDLAGAIEAVLDRQEVRRVLARWRARQWKAKPYRNGTMCAAIREFANDVEDALSAGLPAAREAGSPAPVPTVSDGENKNERLQPPPPEVERVIAEMRRANAAIDAADDPAAYQTGLIALALTARQFLRALSGAGRQEE
jgi:cytosine/adenosine deaminase-related metal-dependent hydrolase